MVKYIYPEIGELVTGLSPVNQRTTPPEGNYPSGLHCEEYKINGRWLQIARDPTIGGEVVECYWSDEEADEWIVG
jgi:hypothetical protein